MAVTTLPAINHPRVEAATPSRHRFSAFAVLARRRFTLSAGTPREIVIPLLTPVLFALVIAPALADMASDPGGIDYMSYVAVATIGLLVPLSCLSAGTGVIVDRQTGARRDLLAAPVPRSLLVVANAAVALVISLLQVAVLLVAASLRGADFDVTARGAVWFGATAVVFALAMYGIAEALANGVPSHEEYIAALPAVAIVPWFFAGSLFPISALPAGLAAFAKILPLTHALALMRYGLVDPDGDGLRGIWGMSNVTAMAGLSLGVVAVFAVGATVLALRSLARSSVQ